MIRRLNRIIRRLADKLMVYRLHLFRIALEEVRLIYKSFILLEY